MGLKLLLLFLGMGLVTYLLRMLPLMALANTKIPSVFKRWLSYVPAAVLSALIFPGILLQSEGLDLSPSKVKIIASLISGVIALKTRNLVYTTLGGIVSILILTPLLKG